MPDKTMSLDDTRTRILNSAGQVFAEKGFQSATVREICQAAEVNLAAVNYYFGDKERLYIETVRRAREMRAKEAPLPDWPPGTSPDRKLRDFVRTMLTRMTGLQAAPWQVQLMMREVIRPTSACKALVEDYFRPHFNLLLGILDEMLPEETPQHRRHQFGFSIIGQCLYYRVAGEVVALMVGDEELKDHYGVTQLADHISEVSLAALGVAPPLGAARATVQSKIN